MNEQHHVEALTGRARALHEGRLPGAAAGVRLPDEERLELMDRVLGRYCLKARVGRGQLGDIFEALDETSLALRTERTVAIQFLDDRFLSDRDFFEKLECGYAALRDSPHPNVVEFLDFSRDVSGQILVLEFLEGASLRFALDCVSLLPVGEVAAVIRGIGNALQYLHAKSMVHGRVKPENVFVTDNYEVKLLDLVPAMPASPIPGSSSADAPDMRDDVFGLACLAYELLTGRHPFNSNSPAEARRAGLDPAPIDSLSVHQWHALARGLVLDPEQRTPTIGAFLDEFGIRGTESLQRGDSDLPAALPVPPTATQSRELGSRPTVSFAADREPFETRFVRSPGRRVGFGQVAAVVVCAGMIAGAFVYRDVLAERAIALIAGGESGPPALADSVAADESAMADESTAAGESAVTGENALAGESAATGKNAVAGESAAVGESAVAGQSAAAGEIALAGESAGTSERAATGEDALADQVTLVDDGTVADEVSAVAPPSIVQSSAQVAASPAAPTPSSTDAQVDAYVPEFAFAESAISVRESSPAVEIELGRASDAGVDDSIVWWTGDRTALAGEDYAGESEREERFAAGEASHELFVPLVNDSLPEPAESFLVYAGRHDPQSGKLEIIAQVTVDIVDDD